MSYEILQQYWWFLVSLLGALLVFLLFVQGANSLVGSLGGDAEGRRLVINSTGRKWEFTFTTLVTFGGAFFASFPLFYLRWGILAVDDHPLLLRAAGGEL